MSLITRCPACETIFKVVPDQLRISEGWVRCGQCHEVFDAAAHLLDLPAEAAPADPALDMARPASTLTAEVRSAAMEPVREEFRVLDEAAPLLPQRADPAEAAASPVMPDVTGAAAELAEVSFMQDRRAAAFWRRPLVHAALVLTGLLLCVSLIVQVLVYERDRIATVAPGLKPVVEAVCAVLQCRVAPLRQIDAIVIEGASFNKIRGDLYRLNFTLRNTALTDLAVPAIELSLTDSQEQLVLRRVFQPAEFGVDAKGLPGASETSGSLALSLRVAGDAERIAGYRVLAFYP